MKYRIAFYTFLGLALVSALYFRNNADDIFASVADGYYKRNNLVKAQEFYEKSFNLGNKNYKHREIYVNSLVNSPLTIEGQEKLAKIASDDVQDSASLKAKYFLYDMRREIYRKYPNNYINQASQNKKIVHWSKKPITYAFMNPAGVPVEFLEEIQAAFNEWQVKSGGAVEFANSTPAESNILINFINNEKVSDLKYGQNYVIAYTTPDIQDNKLKKMVMKFNVKDVEGNTYSRNQIYNTALHEIFHALGFMGHSAEKNNIMYLAKDNETLFLDLREKLSSADIETVKLLYSIKPDITNSANPDGMYTPYLVIGDDEDISYNKHREAKNYISKAPTLPNGYIDLAESFVIQKKYPEAIRALERALSLSTTVDVKYIVYYNLAVSYYYMGNYEMSVDNVQKALQIKDSEELHALKAQNYIKLENMDKALDEYKILVERDGNNLLYAVGLAEIYTQRRCYLKARKVLKTYLKLHPEDKNKPEITRFGVLRY